MRYNAFNVDEIGSSHIEKGLPKQDSSDSASGVTENNIPYAIAIVADGHGGSQYFRSDKGSKLAVEVCKEIVLELIEKNIDAKKNEDKIKRKIKINWDKKVTEHFEKEGKRFNSTELEYFRNEIEQTDNSTKKNKLNEYLKKYESADKITPVTIKAYGSTLIAVAAWNDIVMGIHIGDGTCVALYEDGTMNQPIPEDENNVANIAGSLCNEEPNCRVYFFEKMPIAVFVASDGLDDSFGYGGSLYQFYRKLCMNFIDDGPDYKNTLQKRLAEISARGSHDDMSIAGIYNYKLLCNCKNVLKAVIELGEVEVQLAKCQEECDGLEYQMKAKQTKFESAKRNKSDAEKEIDEIKSAKDSVLDNIKKNQNYISRQTISNNYKKNHLFSEKKMFSPNRDKISDLRTIKEEIEKLEIEKCKLNREVELKQEEINDLTEKKEKLEKYLNVENIIKELKSKYDKLNESINQKSKDLESIKKSFNESEKDFDDIKSKNQALKDKISKLEKNKSKLKDQVKCAVEEFRKQVCMEKPCATISTSTEKHSDKPFDDSNFETDMIDKNNVVQNDFDKNNPEEESTENISYPEENTLGLLKNVESAAEKSESEEIADVTVSIENQLDKSNNDSPLKTDSKVIESQENISDGIKTPQDDDMNKSDKTGLSVVESKSYNLENSSKFNASTIISDSDKKEVDKIIRKSPFFKEIVDRWITKDHSFEDDEQYWEDYINLYRFFEEIIKDYHEIGIKERIEKYPVLLIHGYILNTKRNQTLKESVDALCKIENQQIDAFENIFFIKKEDKFIKKEDKFKRQTDEAIGILERKNKVDYE